MPLPHDLLSERERRFVEALAGESSGNQTKAAILAGYPKSSAHVAANRLLKRAKVRAALARRSERESTAAIADAHERRARLTAFARDSTLPVFVRIKADDTLNKMDGLYVQKHEHTGTFTLLELLTGEPATATTERVM